MLKRMDIYGVIAINMFCPPYWKRFYFKEKTFAPTGSKLSSFKEEPVLEESCCAEKQTESHKGLENW